MIAPPSTSATGGAALASVEPAEKRGGDETGDGDVPHHCAVLSLAPEGGADAADPAVLVGPASVEALRRGTAPPLRGFLEAGTDGLAQVGRRCFGAARGGGLVLSLTTAAAFALPVVEIATGAVRRRFGLPGGEVAELMEICLAEAVSNAVIHGNLGIPDHLRATQHGFDSFRKTMRERLADPEMAARRVEIVAEEDGPDAVRLSVTDHGTGFDLAAQLRRVVRSDARCGRGLGLIRRACGGVRTDDGGRTLVMVFSR